MEQHIPIGLPHGMAHELVPNRAAVHEKELFRRLCPRVGRQAHPAHETQVAGAGFHRASLLQELRRQHIRHAALKPTPGGQPLRHPGAVAQLEAHFRPRQRLPAQHVAHMGGFGALRLQELAPRRRVVEQVRHFHRGAARMGCRPAALLLAAGDGELGAAVTARCRDDGQPGNGGDAGQRFAAETQSGDALQICRGFDFAGGEAAHRQTQVLGVHAAAIIAHHDAFHAAALDGDGDGAGIGVEAVLQELLHDGRRPFHHLAGGDLVGDELREFADARHGYQEPRGITSTCPTRMVSPVRPLAARNMPADTR